MFFKRRRQGNFFLTRWIDKKGQIQKESRRLQALANKLRKAQLEHDRQASLQQSKPTSSRGKKIEALKQALNYSNAEKATSEQRIRTHIQELDRIWKMPEFKETVQRKAKWKRRRKTAGRWVLKGGKWVFVKVPVAVTKAGYRFGKVLWKGAMEDLDSI